MNTHRSIHSIKVQPKGSTLMVVLIITTVLTTLVLSSLVVVNHGLETQYSGASETEAEALAQKGLSFGCHPDISRDSPLLQYVSDDGKKSYQVSIHSEGGKINVNEFLERGDKALFRELFVSWGVPDEEVDSIVDAMVDWIDRNDLLELNGAERDEYRELGYVDRPYNKPFDRVSDLALVRGFQSVIASQPDWKDYFSVVNDSKLDIHEIAPELLSVASGIELSEAESYYEELIGEDEILGTADDVRYPSLQSALTSAGVNITTEEGRGAISRFRLRSSVLAVTSIGKSDTISKKIKVVIRQSTNRPVVIHFEEELMNGRSNER